MAFKLIAIPALIISIFQGPPPTIIALQHLSLKPACNAVDAGISLANINAGYNGSSPDLGAYELGQGLPHYGPRPTLPDLIFVDGFESF